MKKKKTDRGINTVICKDIHAIHPRSFRHPRKYEIVPEILKNKVDRFF